MDERNSVLKSQMDVKGQKEEREGVSRTNQSMIALIWNNQRKKMQELDDGWPESEKDVFQAALRMVVVKDSR
jgi:hypothetical protein